MNAMDAPAWVQVSLLVLALIVGSMFFFRLIRRKIRRTLSLRQRFSDAERVILDASFPRYRQIPKRHQARFESHTRVIMEEKNFEACGGLPEVTEKMKLIIAAQAAILLVALPKHRFFPRLKSILVYPGAFHDGGRRSFDIPEMHTRDILIGESWETGSVVLSWDSVVAGGRRADDGMNVVIHEFAHQLDQLNGAADGVPHLPNRKAYAQWGEVFGKNYAALVAMVNSEDREEIFLDPYAVTDPAEFFAVTSEAFFEDPEGLMIEHPDVYGQLRDYYGLDPASWPKENGV